MKKFCYTLHLCEIHIALLAKNDKTQYALAGSFPGGNHSGGSCLGGSCPKWQLS